MTSPVDYTSAQVGVDQPQSPSSMYGLIHELNALSEPLWPGHVSTHGYDSADHSSWYPGRSVPKPEVGEKNRNEMDNSMAAGGRQLDTHGGQDTDLDEIHRVERMTSAVEDTQATPTFPLPPPPPLPAPVLTPVPSTNFRLPVVGGETKTFPVTVFDVQYGALRAVVVRHK